MTGNYVLDSILSIVILGATGWGFGVLVRARPGTRRRP